MKVIKRKLPFERGQSIVIFTVSLAVLLMLMALVLDGGLLLVRRREAQASADAGALRGVLYICGNSVTETDGDTAEQEGMNYAINENHASSATALAVIENNTLRVTATISQTPALAGLMGYGPIDVSATATAQCQNAGFGTQLMPFVFACEPPTGELAEDYEDCVQKIAADPDDPIEYEEYYLIHDSNDVDDDLLCIYPPGTTPSDPDYEYGDWDCDFDDDGINDIIDHANRGWISLEAGTNPGASTLIDWITNGFEGEITTHMWAGGSTGTENSVFQSIWDLQVPDGFPVVFVPVFNAVCNTGGVPGAVPEDVCESKYHNFPPDPQDITLTLTGAQKYYHITAFAAFQITCVHASPHHGCPFRNSINIVHPDYPPGPLMASGGIASVEGYFIGVVDPDFGSGGSIDTGVYVAKLIQ